MYDKVFSGLRSFAAARLVTQIVSWVGTVFVVRTIDSEALGLFALAFVVFNYASLVFEGGFAEALVQRPPEQGLERRAIFTVLLGGGILLAAVLIAASAAIGRMVGEPAVAPYIAVSAVSLVMTSLAVLPYAQLARQMAFNRLALIDAIQALLTTTVTVSLAYAAYGAWSLVLGAVAGTAFRSISLNLAAPGSMQMTSQIGGAIRYVRFGGWVFADAILWLAYTTADTLFLGRWTGAASVGYFRLGQEVANMALEKISTVVNQVSLPAYAEIAPDRSSVARLTLETIRTHAVIGFPVFWGLAVVAQPLVAVLFGERWNAAVLPMIAFAFVAPLRLIGSIESPAMTGTGYPDVLVKTKLFMAPLMIVALGIGISQGGIAGAAWTWMIIFPVGYLISFHFILAKLDLGFRDVWPVVRGPIGAALLMVVLVQCLRWMAGAWQWPAISELIIAIGAGAAIYAVSLRMMDASAFRLTLVRARRLLGVRTAG